MLNLMWISSPPYFTFYTSRNGKKTETESLNDDTQTDKERERDEKT